MDDDVRSRSFFWNLLQPAVHLSPDTFAFASAVLDERKVGRGEYRQIIAACGCEASEHRAVAADVPPMPDVRAS